MVCGTKVSVHYHSDNFHYHHLNHKYVPTKSLISNLSHNTHDLFMLLSILHILAQDSLASSIHNEILPSLWDRPCTRCKLTMAQKCIGYPFRGLRIDIYLGLYPHACFGIWFS